jgi:glyoxylase-like metal-dependent hydrolase (beta-lactamase superfamily II)
MTKRRMGEHSYRKGLVEVGQGLHAYMQPDGSWGFSNAGLVVDGKDALLVDTLFDRALTREMLDTMHRALPDAAIGALVNTHANGDHCWGNQDVGTSRIISSTHTAREMRELPPARVALMVKAARLAVASGPLATGAAQLLRALRLGPLANLLEAAPFVARIFAPFQFGGITLTPPTQTFDGSLTLNVGSRTVELLEVGPAHTSGDVVVHVPDARAVFTGDILFIEGHPVVWEGPLSNWVKALDRILALNPAVVVPGHGPLTDQDGIRRLRHYLVYVEEQATLRHKAGMDVRTAALDISLDAFRGWGDPERIAINVATVYRHLEGREKEKVNVVAGFGHMAHVAAAMKRRGG